jgi:hypothetical protein
MAVQVVLHRSHVSVTEDAVALQVPGVKVRALPVVTGPAGEMLGNVLLVGADVSAFTWTAFEVTVVVEAGLSALLVAVSETSIVDPTSPLPVV